MTDETSERDTLYVTDAELIRRMGVPEKIAREAIRALDKNPRVSGFPQKQALFGNRRYYPACKAYFDKASGLPRGPQEGEMGMPKMRFCCNCGAGLGVYADRDYDRRDTCGAQECEREMRQQDIAERDEAHEQLDRDLGW
ncbi:MAG: hypothetical protein JWP25_8989 [Bradyrhizobium sp.]|nr:hypothetical protein [Bradyrhizobium sp.]